MASSSRPIEEGQERTYWYRCSRLLIEGSLAILKEFLKNHCKGQLGSFLNTNKGILQRLHSKRILSQDQMNQLFSHVDLESLDITLITCILLNCQPKLQPAQDQSLKEIRDLRNELFAHISSLSLEENEFNYNWGLIEKRLSNAENVLGVNTCLRELVDKVTKEEIGNIERFRDELNAWKCSDDKILSALEAISKKQRKFSKKQTKFSKKQTKISKKQTKCSRKLDDVAENVEEIKARLPKRFKGEGDDVNKEVTDEEWSELQNCLMNDYKKFIIKAPITAEFLSYETDIDHIYVEPKLLLIDHTASSKEKSDKNQKTITPEDIFRSDRNKCSNIYVSGDAGMGKTSLCKNILSAWCKAHQKGETSKSGFVLALEQYNFAFYISLRHATGQDHIEDMIVSQRLQHIVSNNNTKLRGFQPKFLLNEVLRLKSEKCLIILDGLDEWQLSENLPSENDGIPLRDSNLNYTILTTTRPWKLEQLRLKESRIDKQVEITGVKDTAMFAEKLILCYNEREERNETFDNFNQCLSDNDLTELRETPFLLKHLVCLWFYKQNIRKSKTEVFTNMIELWLHNAEKRKGVKHLCPSIIDHNIGIPNVFKKHGKCDQYTALLKAVGKLAYVTATQGEVIQLVFDSTDKYGISEDQMRICLDVGILTQNIVPDMTCERKSISFPHKTFHEFFAALYILWHWPKHGVHNCTAIERLIGYEWENMCLFLSAIWPSVLKILIKVHFSKFKNKRELSIQYEYLKDLLVKWCSESIAVNKNCPKVEIKYISLGDISLFNERKPPSIMDKKIFSVLSTMLETKISTPNMIGDVVDFSSVSFLWILKIYNRQYASLTVSPCLYDMTIRNVDIVTPEGTVDLISSIAKAKNLKRLQIYDFNVDRKFLVTLDLSNNENLRILSLKTMYANKLSASLNITELTVCDFHSASHEEIVSTIRKMSNLTRLVILKLSTIYCSEHGSHKKCFLDFDLSETSTLIVIKLRSVSFSTLRVSPDTANLYFKDIHLASYEDQDSLMKHGTYPQIYKHSKRKLKAMRKVKHKSHSQYFRDVDLLQNGTTMNIKTQNMSLYNLTLDAQLASHDAIVSLMEYVTNLTELRNLSLRNVYCSEHKSHSQCFLDVDLSQNSDWCTIELQGMSFSKLSLSPTTKKLTFRDIQLASHEDLLSLITNVTNMTELDCLSLRNVYCSEHKSHSQCFLEVDLSQNSTLRTIKFQGLSVSKLIVSPTTEKLTFHDIQLTSHKDLVSLMKIVTNLTTLGFLDLKTVYCSEHKSHSQCFLDVDLSKSDISVIFFKALSLSNLVLSQTTNKEVLRHFILDNIQFASHEEVVLLREKMKSYCSLSLTNVYCKEHSECMECRLFPDCQTDGDADNDNVDDNNSDAVCDDDVCTDLINYYFDADFSDNCFDFDKDDYVFFNDDNNDEEEEESYDDFISDDDDPDNNEFEDLINHYDDGDFSGDDNDGDYIDCFNDTDDDNDDENDAAEEEEEEEEEEEDSDDGELFGGGDDDDDDF